MPFLNIPKGRSDFETIRREGFYYVDKTGLIGEILKSSGTQVTLITRPRRFGKTLGMSTLECFLDIQKDSKSLFDGLEISKQRNICDEWMNQWPVMSLSLKAVEGNDFSTAYMQLVYEVGELYKKHEYIMQSSVLNEEEKKLYWNIRYQHAGKIEVMRSLYILSEFLSRYYNKNVIILIDEYDVPMARATSNGYYKEMLEIMKGFMQALKDNSKKWNKTELFSAVWSGDCDTINGHVAIFETKRAAALDNLESECDKALQQIDERMYAKDFEDEYDSDHIHCYGIAFYKKRCLVKKK